jgi:hypothetical protein
VDIRIRIVSKSPVSPECPDRACSFRGIPISVCKEGRCTKKDNQGNGYSAGNYDHVTKLQNYNVYSLSSGLIGMNIHWSLLIGKYFFYLKISFLQKWT